MIERRPESSNHINDDSYALYTRGMELLESGDFAAAAVPLGKVASREPGKSSVREALGRALFRSRRFAEAATEFEAEGEKILTTHARTEMRKSVSRLKRELRSAFAVGSEPVAEVDILAEAEPPDGRH